jgi:hypothetical protein
MVRGLLAPLSPREVLELLHLLHGRDFQPDPAACKRFVMELVKRHTMNTQHDWASYVGELDVTACHLGGFTRPRSRVAGRFS